MDVSQIESCAQHMPRTAPLIAQADEEYFLLNIQRRGSSLVQQDGREAKLVSGNMALYSSARRYELTFDAAFSQTALIFPTELKMYLTYTWTTEIILGLIIGGVTGIESTPAITLQTALHS